MRIAIAGIGAMGALFAARLSTVADVIMIGNWKEQLMALKKGLTLIHTDGRKTSYCIPATNTIHNIASVDMVLILVKSYQTERAVKQAAVLLSGESPLNLALSLQNGVGNQEKIERVLGAERSFIGVTSQAATILEPGVVQDTGPGSVYLGNPAQESQKPTKLAELFSDAGFKVQLFEDIRSLVWGKLAVNAGINPLTAILNQKNGYIGAHEITRRLMFQLARETANVAAAQRIVMPYPDVEHHLITVSHATRANHSSMLRDIQRNSPTEIDAICGVVIEKGKEYGVPTPVNKHIFDMIKEIESGKRKPGLDTDFSHVLKYV